MKKLKQSLHLLKENIWTLVGFSALYKAITILLFVPLFVKLFQLIMDITGYTYLTLENIIPFLTTPITLISILLLIFLMTFYSLFDIAVIIIILDASYQHKKIKIKTAISIFFKKAKTICNPQNFALPFLLLFLIPFLNIGMSSSFITSISIPEFITEYITSTPTLSLLLFLILLLLTILLVRWLYSIHYLILEDSNFKIACQKSARLGSKKHFKDLTILFLIQLFIYILYSIFLAITLLLFFLISKLFTSHILLKTITTTIIWIIIALSFLIFASLSTPISYTGISLLYYNRKQDNQEKITPLALKTTNNSSVCFQKITILLLTIALFVASIFTYNIYKGNIDLNIEYIRKVDVTAHRGASFQYPENTMIAFKGAKVLGADWIELDVQQTKDGQIIVLHDTNLKRVTGLNKNIWEVTYDEIKDLDAGSFFDKKYKNEHIPLLEEVITFASSNNIRLNIELKPTGHEDHFEQNVVDLITANSFENYCVITSQAYSSLEKVKKYNKNIETVYVMSLAYGDITNLKYADNFSVETSNVTKRLISNVHNAGKELYVWTVNNEDNLKKMIDYNIDNIITDNITLAKDTIMKSKTSNLMNEYIKWIENIFK